MGGEGLAFLLSQANPMILRISHTIGGDADLGLIDATSICRKMYVSKIVRDMFNLPSLWNGMKTEAIPVMVTSNIGMIKLKICNEQ